MPVRREQVAAALRYMQQLRDRANEFGVGVAKNLTERAQSAGGLAYEALTSDPNIGRMTTAEYAQAADRPTPRLDQTASELGTLGRAVLTQPIETGKTIVRSEVERARGALDSPQAAGEYAGSLIDPLRLASALRTKGPIAEIDVYQGSPHRFEPTPNNPLGEFDASKIGTGEGAQAYGHGIYTAESPEVAKGYAKTLANRDPANQNRLNAHANAQRLANLAGDPKAAADDIRYALEVEPNHSQKELLSETLQMLDSGEYKNPLKNQGYLYTADLPDEMVDRMLDWDKPFLEQSDEIKKFAKNSLPAAVYNQLLTQRSGDMVEELAKYKGGKAKASELMRQAGIPGIRYLDAGSRGQGGSGTRNFVVFPGEEKKVKILKRE